MCECISDPSKTNLNESFNDYDSSILDILQRLSIPTQLHEHTESYCLKDNKCRFGFPKRILIYPIFSNFNNRNVRLVFKFHASRNHRYVNSYSLSILLYIECNCDFQFIIGQELVASYITKYVTKQETISKFVGDLLDFGSSQNDNSLGKVFFQSSMNTIAGRELSFFEICLNICPNTKLYRSSKLFKTISLFPSNPLNEQVTYLLIGNPCFISILTDSAQTLFLGSNSKTII